IALAEEHSVTRAAKRLGIPQPALTAQLKRIERDLGRLIFQRTGRGVILTQEGEQLLPLLRTIDSGMRALEHSKPNGPVPEPTPIRVGVECAALLDALETSLEAQAIPAQLAVTGPPRVRSALQQSGLDFMEISELSTGRIQVTRPLRSATVVEDEI